MKSFAVRAFGVLLLMSAMALSFTRAPDLPVQALVARWGQLPSEFIDVNGQLVHLRDEGPGAVSMMTGSAPATALITMRARGFRPCALA